LVNKQRYGKKNRYDSKDYTGARCEAGGINRHKSVLTKLKFLNFRTLLLRGIPEVRKRVPVGKGDRVLPVLKNQVKLQKQILSSELNISL